MSFEKILLEAIDEGFSWMGKPEKQAVYSYLERNCRINKQDIPGRLADFVDALENIFGVSAKLLEIEIMKCLFSKIGHFIPDFHSQEGLEFIEYVETAKNSWNRRIPFRKNLVCISH